MGSNLLGDPDLADRDATVAFKTALWFWMTPQAPKPSCHDVMKGQWKPGPKDVEAGRSGGYGTITNIINGGLECGKGPDDRVNDRIGSDSTRGAVTYSRSPPTHIWTATMKNLLAPTCLVRKRSKKLEPLVKKSQMKLEQKLMKMSKFKNLVWRIHKMA